MISKKYAFISALTILVLVTGAIVTRATIPSANGVIYACYNKSGGTLRVIDRDVTNCSANETQVTWNQTGPIGPTGPQGPTGATGATGAQGPTGPSDIFVSGMVNTFGGGSDDVVVKTLSLPQGSYLVGAKVGVLRTDTSSTSSRTLQCRIATTLTLDFASIVDSVRTEISDGFSTGFVALAGPLVVPPSGQTVDLICAQTPFQFDNAMLYATLTGNLHVQ